MRGGNSQHLAYIQKAAVTDGVCIGESLAGYSKLCRQAAKAIARLHRVSCGSQCSGLATRRPIRDGEKLPRVDFGPRLQTVGRNYRLYRHPVCRRDATERIAGLYLVLSIGVSRGQQGGEREERDEGRGK